MEFFKRYMKYTLVLVCFISMLVFFMFAKTFAKPSLEIKKLIDNTHSTIGVLYSDNSLYFHDLFESGRDYPSKIENVVDFEFLNYEVVYLDTSGRLYLDNVLVFENVNEIFRFKRGGHATFSTNDNKLYVISLIDNEYFGEYNIKFTHGYTTYYIYSISENVKSWNESGMYVDFNNNLYVYGRNNYGQKVNNGNYIEEPILLLENIVDYNEYYALDKDGNLYVFSIGLPQPTIIKTDIKSVGDYYDIFDVNSYQSHYDTGMLSLKNKDGNDYFIHYNVDDDVDILFYGLIENNISSDKINSFEYDNCFLMNGTLYYYEYSKFYKIMDNVKKFVDSYVLTDEGILYFLPDIDSEFVNTDFMYSIFHRTLFEGNKPYKIMNNVIDMIKTNNDDVFFVMNDNTLMIDFSFEQIGGLPNTSDVVSVYDVNLVTLDKTKFTVGEKFDYYVNVFPLNARNNEVKWTSSNPDVASVSSNGLITMLSPGKTIISVESVDGNIKDSQEINVYPDVSGVEIKNGDSLDLALYEEVIITAEIFPKDTINNTLVWTVSDNDAVRINSFQWSDTGMEELPNNQRRISVIKGGKYTVTVTTENGLYNDTIELNTVEKVNSISLEFDDDHFDGVYNAFIYLSESNELKPKYTLYPETATNKKLIWNSSNPDVAVVSDDGVITGKKIGKTKITVQSEDGFASTSFNLLVYDYSSQGMIGDINGDGKVNLQDLTKLRKYLAGLEELE